MIRYQVVRILRKFFYDKPKIDELLTDKESIEIQKSQVVDFPDSLPISSHTHPINEITNFPDTMPPSNHSHGNLQNDGQVGSAVAASKNVVTDSNGKITTEDKYVHPNTGALNGLPLQNKNLNFGDEFQVSPTVVNAQGHVTQLNPKTLSLPTLPVASSTRQGVVKIGEDSNSAAAGNHAHNASNVLFTPTVEAWQGIGNPSNVGSALNNSFEYVSNQLDGKQSVLEVSHRTLESRVTENGKVHLVKYGKLVIANFGFTTSYAGVSNTHHLVSLPSSHNPSSEYTVLPSISTIDIVSGCGAVVYIRHEDNGEYHIRVANNTKNKNFIIRGELMWVTD